MEVKVVKINVLGKSSYGVVYLVKTVAPVYNQIYVLNVEREQGMVYNMFLEYIPGGSLLNLMNRYGGKIPERDVNCYTQMILEGLLDIHEKGYIHSDLKSGNILVFPLQHGTGLSTLKITDFRLAKQQEIKDTRSGFQGT
ncbi:hypothetical protein Goshw_022430, partial [Gossypium schwendimanii]|nr:hypothetical protein [Gossypium schwendimanii]